MHDSRNVPLASRPGHDVHAERLPELRDAEADRPQADDAERLPGQLEAAEAAVLQAARSRRFVRVEETAPECEQRPERELGDGLRRRGGDDCDGHALRRRGLDVDVRVAGRARGDESQVGKALEHGGVDLRVRVERDEHAGRRGARDDRLAVRRAEADARG